ncbi:hypothetical protein HN446_05030 [bacterium]|jgi:uncharacterized protein YjbI with pentapeptide repeats|nr:hypothetical protein [bacterium]
MKTILNKKIFFLFLSISFLLSNNMSASWLSDIDPFEKSLKNQKSEFVERQKEERVEAEARQKKEQQYILEKKAEETLQQKEKHQYTLEENAVHVENNTGSPIFVLAGWKYAEKAIFLSEKIESKKNGVAEFIGAERATLLWIFYVDDKNQKSQLFKLPSLKNKGLEVYDGYIVEESGKKIEAEPIVISKSLNDYIFGSIKKGANISSSISLPEPIELDPLKRLLEKGKKSNNFTAIESVDLNNYLNENDYKSISDSPIKDVNPLFRNCSFGGVKFGSATFRTCLFKKNSKLDNAILDGAKLPLINIFDGSSMKNASCKKTYFSSSWETKLSYFESAPIFLNVDFSGTDFSGAKFERFGIVGCDATDSNFDSASFNTGAFEKIKGLNKIKNFNKAKFENVTFVDINMSGIDFSGINLIDCKFSNVTGINGSSFDNSVLNRTTLNGYDFSNKNFKNCSFIESNLSNINFDGADLSGADFKKTKFSKVNLNNTNLSSAKNLELTTLSKLSIKGANLSGINFEGIDFSGKDLSGCNFSGCNLSKAKFDKANLNNSKFNGANLSGASFSGSYIQGADFTGIKNYNNSTFLSSNANDETKWVDGKNIKFNTASVYGISIEGRDGFILVNMRPVSSISCWGIWKKKAQASLVLRNIEAGGGMGECKFIDSRGADYLWIIENDGASGGSVFSMPKAGDCLCAFSDENSLLDTYLQSMTFGAIYKKINIKWTGSLDQIAKQNKVPWLDVAKLNNLGAILITLGSVKNTSGKVVNIIPSTIVQIPYNPLNLSLGKVNPLYEKSINLKKYSWYSGRSEESKIHFVQANKKINGVSFEKANISKYFNGKLFKGFFPGTEFDSCNFEHAILDRLDLSQVTFKNCNLKHASFKQSNLSMAVFSECKGEDVDFSIANLEGATFNTKTYSSGYFYNSNFNKTNLKDVVFGGTFGGLKNLKDSINYKTIKFAKTCSLFGDFSGLNLSGMNFSGVGFGGTTNFKGANLQKANFSNSDFSGVDFENANLNNSIFDNPQVSYGKKGCPSFKGAQLRNVKITPLFNFSIRIGPINFSGADLRGADMTALKENDNPFWQLVKISHYKDYKPVYNFSTIKGACVDKNTKWIDGRSAAKHKKSIASYGMCFDQWPCPNFLNMTTRKTITGNNFSNMKISKLLSGKNIKTNIFTNCVFDYCDMSELNLSSKTFKNCSFIGTILKNVDFKNSSCINTKFDKSIVYEADFSGANLSGALFNSADLKGVKNINKAKNISSVFDFDNADLSGIDLSGISWKQRKTNKKRTSIKHVVDAKQEEKFSALAKFNSSSYDSIGEGAFGGYKLKMKQETVVSSDYIKTGPSFVGAKMAGVNLKNSSLKESWFSGADLTGAILNNADVQGSLFANAVLVKADLRGANLKDARYFGSKCSSSDLKAAVTDLTMGNNSEKISNKLLKDAVLDSNTTWLGGYKVAKETISVNAGTLFVPFYWWADSLFEGSLNILKNPKIILRHINKNNMYFLINDNYHSLSKKTSEHSSGNKFFSSVYKRLGKNKTIREVDFFFVDSGVNLGIKSSYGYFFGSIGDYNINPNAAKNAKKLENENDVKVLIDISSSDSSINNSNKPIDVWKNTNLNASGKLVKNYVSIYKMSEKELIFKIDDRFYLKGSAVSRLSSIDKFDEYLKNSTNGSFVKNLPIIKKVTIYKAHVNGIHYYQWKIDLKKSFVNSQGVKASTLYYIWSGIISNRYYYFGSKTLEICKIPGISVLSADSEGSMLAEINGKKNYLTGLPLEVSAIKSILKKNGFKVGVNTIKKDPKYSKLVKNWLKDSWLKMNIPKEVQNKIHLSLGKEWKAMGIELLLGSFKNLADLPKNLVENTFGIGHSHHHNHIKENTSVMSSLLSVDLKFSGEDVYLKISIGLTDKTTVSYVSKDPIFTFKKG